MTSPIAKIKAGVGAGDWALVCDGYAGLTGERLDPPAAEVVPLNIRLPDDFYEKVAAAALGLRQPAVPPAVRPAPVPTGGDATPPPAGFVDDGTVAPDEIAQSRELSARRAPAPRRPRAPRPTLTCVGCERPFTVAPEIGAAFAGKDAPEYRCDGCLVRGKGGKRRDL